MKKVKWKALCHITRWGGSTVGFWIEGEIPLRLVDDDEAWLRGALHFLETQWPETGVAASWERATMKAVLSREPSRSAETAAARPEGR